MHGLLPRFTKLLHVLTASLVPEICTILIRPSSDFDCYVVHEFRGNSQQRNIFLAVILRHLISNVIERSDLTHDISLSIRKDVKGTGSR